MIDILVVSLSSYISGSIPFGLVLTKIIGKKDIRKIGSGNIGATNVLRTGNKFLAAITLLLDILKGYIPAIIFKQIFPDLFFLSCLLVFLGHLFPIWLNFKGGKGVATYLGVLFAISYQLSFLFIFTWVVLTLIFKYSSISSIFACFTVFAINFIREFVGSIILIKTDEKIILDNYQFNASFLLFIFLILIIFTHKRNISNLKNNTEQKIKL